MNDMVKQLGRRLMSGDVIEVLHMRDDLALDGIPINKFYVVEDGTRSAEGFSPTWWPHLWRVKCQPLTDSAEFQDILGKQLTDRGDGITNEGLVDKNGDPLTIGGATSRYDQEIAVNDALLDAATQAVKFRNLQSAHFYIQQDALGQKPDIWNSDGIPPNDSKPVPSGTSWPSDALQGDYFLRLDYDPPTLFQRTANSWHKIESNYRSEWLPANRVLSQFINDRRTTTLQDGHTETTRQNLREVVKPKLDPDIL
jgi:hypothetical protein